MNEHSKTHQCCICGESFVGWGNNPDPFNGERACDDCNDRFVVPARMIMTAPMNEETEKGLKQFAQLGKMFIAVRRQARSKVLRLVELE